MTWLPPPAAPALPATVPVFPLPGLVFFPGTVLPLHVFEPRYQRMVRDARAGQGLIALALLKPGWEPEYYDAPEVHPLGCVGRLIEVVELPEGRFNIKLAGVCRAEFLSFESDIPYRTARIRALPEHVPPEGSPAVAEAKSDLLCAYSAWASELTGETPTGLEGAVSAPLHPWSTRCAPTSICRPRPSKGCCAVTISWSAAAWPRMPCAGSSAGFGAAARPAPRSPDDTVQ